MDNLEKNNIKLLKILTLEKVKRYILEGAEQAGDILKAAEDGCINEDAREWYIWHGKLAAYNDVYDYIVNVLEEEIDNA